MCCPEKSYLVVLLWAWVRVDTFDIPAASVFLSGKEGEGNMRLLLVQAPHVNFNVCVAEMARASAVSGVGEKHTSAFPFREFSFSPVWCLCRPVTQVTDGLLLTLLLG